MGPNYTSTGMPRVSREAMDALISRYERRMRSDGKTEWGTYLERVRSRMIEDNPEVVEYMSKVVANFPKEMNSEVVASMVGLYAILETQAEANMMGDDEERGELGSDE
jgi:hypothetical protein